MSIPWYEMRLVSITIFFRGDKSSREIANSSREQGGLLDAGVSGSVYVVARNHGGTRTTEYFPLDTIERVEEVREE